MEVDAESSLAIEAVEDVCADNMEPIISERIDETQNDVSCDDSLSELYSYNFNSNPQLRAVASEEYTGSFLKGCKWSPDGSCIMTNCDDNVVRLYCLEESYYRAHTPEESSGNNNEVMNTLVKVSVGLQVYDYAWYPLMSAQKPETACFATTSKNQPVHLWDAYYGKLLCSYRPFNAMDELSSAHSIAFNADGTKLFCGSNRTIRVFDTARPGKEFSERPCCRRTGQSGIISCIATNPQTCGLYAAGSYTRSVALYDESTGDIQCLFQGLTGGVTHLQFSPDGIRLYSGGRKDPEILCWDMRNPGQVLYVCQRDVRTNQRIQFDLDVTGRYITSGDHSGSVIVWDNESVEEVAKDEDETVLKPTLSYKAHSDVVNGVSLHPTLPLLATASGQRHIRDPCADFSDQSDLDGEEEESVDCSLKVWWAGPRSTVTGLNT